MRRRAELEAAKDARGEAAVDEQLFHSASRLRARPHGGHNALEPYGNSNFSILHRSFAHDHMVRIMP